MFCKIHKMREIRKILKQNYEQAMSNMTRDTEKTIKDYTLSILGYDENNFQVKILPQYSFGGKSYEFTGNVKAVNIIIITV